MTLTGGLVTTKFGTRNRLVRRGGPKARPEIRRAAANTKRAPTAHLDVLDELLGETTTVTICGRRTRITHKRRYWLGVLADANKGDRCCRKLIADYLKERARARANAPTGQLIDVEGEPHKFSWTEEQDKLLADLERNRNDYEEALANAERDEERERREREELRADQERLKEEREKLDADMEWAREEHEKVCADLERAKEELARIRSSSPTMQIH